MSGSGIIPIGPYHNLPFLAAGFYSGINNFPFQKYFSGVGGSLFSKLENSLKEIDGIVELKAGEVFSA